MSERIRISTGLGGTNCAVQTDDGLIVRGVRVAPDYVPIGVEGTYWGRCVSTVHRDRKSGLEVFVDDEQQTSLVNGSTKWTTTEDAVVEIVDCEPPTLWRG